MSFYAQLGLKALISDLLFSIVCSRFNQQTSLVRFPTILIMFPTELPHCNCNLKDILKIHKKNPWCFGSAVLQYAGRNPDVTIGKHDSFMSSRSPRSSSEDGWGQTRLFGFFWEANRAGTSETELHEGDASSSPSPSTLCQHPPICSTQLCTLCHPHAHSANCW